MTVKTHWEAGTDNQRIVGFEVEPRSIANKASRLYDPSDAQNKMILKPDEPFRFSYSIQTVNDKSTMWASRMDHYFKKGDHDVHMKELTTCLAMVIGLGGLVAIVLHRIVTRDIICINENVAKAQLSKKERYNQAKKSLINQESKIEEENQGLVKPDALNS